MSFLAALAFFHVSEFSLAAIYDRENLGRHCESLTASHWPASAANRGAIAAAAAAASTALIPSPPQPQPCSLADPMGQLHSHGGGVLGVLGGAALGAGPEDRGGVVGGPGSGGGWRAASQDRYGEGSHCFGPP